jgi:hypothetical protein
MGHCTDPGGAESPAVSTPTSLSPNEWFSTPSVGPRVLKRNHLSHRSHQPNHQTQMDIDGAPFTQGR